MGIEALSMWISQERYMAAERPQATQETRDRNGPLGPAGEEDRNAPDNRTIEIIRTDSDEEERKGGS